MGKANFMVCDASFFMKYVFLIFLKGYKVKE